LIAVNEPQVINLSLHKSGTTSLEDHLVAIGYPSVARAEDSTRVIGTLATLARQLSLGVALSPGLVNHIKRFASQFSVLSDVPWFYYPELMVHLWPNANFIHVVRPRKDWWGSVERHFGQWSHHGHALFYDGVENPKHSPESYLRCRKEHIKRVRALPVSVLEVDLYNEKIGDIVSDYLGRPREPFPHANKSS